MEQKYTTNSEKRGQAGRKRRAGGRGGRMKERQVRRGARWRSNSFSAKFPLKSHYPL